MAMFGSRGGLRQVVPVNDGLLREGLCTDTGRAVPGDETVTSAQTPFVDLRRPAGKEGEVLSSSPLSR